MDLDPQATLTVAYGIDPEQVDRGVDTVLESYSARKGERVKLTDVAVDVELDGKFKHVPSRDYLEGLNVTLTNVLGRERILSKVINDINGFDVVLIDCQPTFSLLTINAMVASDYLIIPVETAYFSLHGLLLLLDTIEMVKEELNPDLKILGIVPFKYVKELICTFTALLGILLMSYNNLGLGNFMLLGCALAFAVEIAMISHNSKMFCSISLAFWQVFSVAVFSIPFSFLDLNSKISFNSSVTFALIITALFATVVARVVQNKFQKFTTAADAAVIFSMEGVFSHLFSFMFLGEKLGLIQLVGAVIIVFSVIAVSL